MKRSLRPGDTVVCELNGCVLRVLAVRPAGMFEVCAASDPTRSPLSTWIPGRHLALLK